MKRNIFPGLLLLILHLFGSEQHAVSIEKEETTTAEYINETPSYAETEYYIKQTPPLTVSEYINETPPQSETEYAFANDVEMITVTEELGKHEVATANQIVDKKFQQLKAASACSCPCDERVVQRPICARSTDGIFQTFTSECHLLCYNTCSGADAKRRFGLLFFDHCPAHLTGHVIYAYKYSKQINCEKGENREEDALEASPSDTYENWKCDCTRCVTSKYMRLDYYPICAERLGRPVTIESWCHFDCENNCVRRTGHNYLYVHSGPCNVGNGNSNNNNRRVGSAVTASSASLQCQYCRSLCQGNHQPLCAKTSNGDHLLFNSPCHLDCHNKCFGLPGRPKYVPTNTNFCEWN